ncbi:MAG: D-alanyl-D-alanine carboxypeptidase family protein [Bacteroidales bacterium]|nr:D-alanyl-D-alanine carboxypeptidase family protein [Bacteroidales bacterium]
MKKFFLNIIVLLLGMASCYAQNHAVATNRKDFLRGLNNFSRDSSFVQMDPKYTRQRAPFNYINCEAYEAFIKMWEAAKQDGINLTIISGARTFLTQKTVWDRRWNESTLPAGATRVKNLLRYSALPGCSRHHYQWLCENAHKFGFYQPYSAKGSPGSGLREKGHEEERWHWSYYPLASVFMKEFAEIMTDEDLKGFSGDKYISTLDVINNFVLGVAPEPTLL